MSYTTKIKNEITDKTYPTTEAIALVSGFVRNNGYLDNDRFFMTTENIQTKEFIKEFFRKNYDIKVDIKETESNNFSKKVLYVISFEDKDFKVLSNLGYMSNGEKLELPNSYIVDGNAEIRGYLRGVFLASGSINDPKTSRYHMEMLLDESREAVFVQKLLNIFDMNAKILNRGKGYMVYLKEAEKISDFIKILGTNKAVMYFEDVRIYHDQKNRTNRLNNCEQANVDKVISAATVQLAHIEIIKENMGVDLLDDKTKEALMYREKYPDASFKELSEIISLETGKKITKSGLNHRFRKIKDLAEKFNDK